MMELHVHVQHVELLDSSDKWFYPWPSGRKSRTIWGTLRAQIPKLKWSRWFGEAAFSTHSWMIIELPPTTITRKHSSRMHTTCLPLANHTSPVYTGHQMSVAGGERVSQAWYLGEGGRYCKFQNVLRIYVLLNVYVIFKTRHSRFS